MIAERSLVVFRKEVRELCRDRRTFITSLLVPLILFPLVFGILEIGLKRAESFRDGTVITVNSTYLREILSRQNDLTIRLSDSPVQDVFRKNVPAAVVTENAPEDTEGSRLPHVSVYYYPGSSVSAMVTERITRILQAYSEAVVHERLAAEEISPDSLKPFSLSLESADADRKDKAAGLALLIPFILIAYSAATPFAAAASNGAGEKERGTLEPLLTTSLAPREILLGKYLAVLFAGVLGVASCLLGFYLAVRVSPGFFNASLTGSDLPDLPVILLIGCTTVLLVMIFGIIELAISLYARTSKEAQTFYIPVMILSLSAAAGLSLVDIFFMKDLLLHIPLLNISILLKELSLGVINTRHLLIVYFWALFYTAGGFLTAYVMISREEVIFRN